MSERTIRVLDTTLRDGEQTPGVSLTPDEKLEIAEALDRLGVDVIEAGFPITSKGEQEGVRRIVKAGLRAEVSGLARAEKVDIDTAINCGVKGVHVFLASSDIHLQHKLHLTREQMVKQSVEMVRYAKGFGVKVEFSAEDATRTEIPFFKQVVKAVTEAGIDRFDIPDQYVAGAAYQPNIRTTLLLEYDRVRYSDLVGGNTLANTGSGRFQIADANEVRFGYEYLLVRGQLLRAYPKVTAFRVGAWYDPNHSIEFISQATTSNAIFRRAYFPRNGKSIVHGSGGIGFRVQDYQVDLGADVSSRSLTLSLSGVLRFGGEERLKL